MLAKSKALEGLEYERGNRDSCVSGIEALQQASNLNRGASSNDRETLAHAAGYELNRSAEELLRDAATPVRRKKRNEREERAAGRVAAQERVALHQQSEERARDEKVRVEQTRIDKTQEMPRDLTQQVPEQEASKTPEGKEIERTREGSNDFILSR